jgi:RNA polymerase sigma-70 factor (ECF subfamily)
MPLDGAFSPDEAQHEVRALYVAHAQALRSGLRRLTWPGCDVDDLLQEVFVVAIRRPAPLLLADSPKAWLYGVAVKVAAAARRKHRLREFLGLEAAEKLTADSVARLDAQLDAAATVHRALGKLSGKKREVLVLFELEGLSGEEIAQVLGCPLKTVWTRLHHARKDFEGQWVRHG